MIASVLWMGAQWFVGALVVFTVLIAPVLLMMQLLTLANRRRRRATKPTKPFAWREEPRPGTGTVRNPITGKLWYVENGKPMREVEEDRSADVVGLLTQREMERMKLGHARAIVDAPLPNEVDMDAPFGIDKNPEPTLQHLTSTGRMDKAEQVAFLARIRGEHPSHDPLYPNPLTMSETEIERVERHRRMQIGEFSPRHRHES